MPGGGGGGNQGGNQARRNDRGGKQQGKKNDEDYPRQPKDEMMAASIAPKATRTTKRKAPATFRVVAATARKRGKHGDGDDDRQGRNTDDDKDHNGGKHDNDDDNRQGGKHNEDCKSPLVYSEKSVAASTGSRSAPIATSLITTRRSVVLA